MHDEAETEFPTKVIGRYDHENDDFIYYHYQCSGIGVVKFFHETVYSIEILELSCNQEVLRDAQILTCKLEIDNDEQKVPKYLENRVGCVEYAVFENIQACCHQDELLGHEAEDLHTS